MPWNKNQFPVLPLASTRAIETGKSHPTIIMFMQNPLKYLPTSLTKNTVSLADVDKHLKNHDGRQDLLEQILQSA